MTGTAGIVAIRKVGRAGLIVLNNPPVNAASRDLRRGLLQAVRTLEADNTVGVIAIYGVTRAFIAGADIREFGKTGMEPSLPEVCKAIENCTKPVLAVLHGPTLGGGLEVAASAHARVALPDTTLGFPEVTLGVLPGAGGTQRSPRLIGISATLDLVTTGRRIGAEEALEIGLVDQVVERAPHDAALAATSDILAGRLPTRRTCDLSVTPDPQAISRVAADLKKRQPHLFSPHACVDAVARSTGPLAEGLAFERALFQDCVASPQCAGLIHAFFAERAVAKIPERGAGTRTVDAVGVVGGGTMGSGIATTALLAGLPVILAERDESALSHGVETISGNLAGAVRRGKISEQQRQSLLNKALTVTTDLAKFDSVDLVIEAVFEDMAVKKSLFGQLDDICKPGAVLATNTSYLDVDAIAAVTTRPADVIGLHFFSPAHVMRLLEIVVADQTAPQVVATGFALAKRLGKVAVRAGVCDGFIGNRILSHYRKAADYLMLDGAAPQDIDDAIRGFGFAMGPFQVSDLAGLDIGWATRKRLAPTRDPAERYVEIADRICERGWFGRKNGQGYYTYGGDSPQPNPQVAAIIDAERGRAGITPRAFSPDDITRRYMTAMIAEAARVLADGIALRPVDIDAVFLFGYGFPRFRGGPMHYADTLGAAELVARIEAFAAEDSHFWQVPPLLREMAENGGSFADMNGS